MNVSLALHDVGKQVLALDDSSLRKIEDHESGPGWAVAFGSRYFVQNANDRTVLALNEADLRLNRSEVLFRIHFIKDGQPIENILANALVYLVRRLQQLV
jgi:hypothetical protein